MATEADSQGIQTVDPQTQARLEALLEAAGKVNMDLYRLNGPFHSEEGFLLVLKIE